MKLFFVFTSVHWSQRTREQYIDRDRSERKVNWDTRPTMIVGVECLLLCPRFSTSVTGSSLTHSSREVVIRHTGTQSQPNLSYILGIKVPGRTWDHHLGRSGSVLPVTPVQRLTFPVTLFPCSPGPFWVDSVDPKETIVGRDSRTRESWSGEGCVCDTLTN